MVVLKGIDETGEQMIVVLKRYISLYGYLLLILKGLEFISIYCDDFCVWDCILCGI